MERRKSERKMEMKLSDEKIAENMVKVQSIVKTFPEARRKLIAKMLSGPVGEEFFTAPASPREEYHCCFPGGLCDHSLRVVDNLYNISQVLVPGRFDLATLNFVGLFHDLGKVGDGVNPYYLPNPEEWARTKRGILYITNKDCAYMPTAERSLFVLQRNGIGLEPDEYLAIRLHDGHYEDANRNYRMKEPDLALLAHFADRWATSQEKDLF